MSFKVKAVADLAGISVRALHHYDQIGLLKPASASPSGYRLYSEGNLERLQQILFFRELGFALPEIAAIIDRPGFDKKQALLTHKQLLLEKQKRLQAMIGSVERTIVAMERGIPMEKESMFEGFDESRMEEYREEARAKYGKEIVDQSYQKVSKYSKEEWAAIQAEGREIEESLASRLDEDPASPEVQQRVEQWFRLINDRYYNCTLEIFRGLGDLYVYDPRFTKHYDKVKPGLAEFMRQAMQIFCDRREKKA
ncbi:MAG TPA: MerR family transcriptional regulator [Chroococcales cyanobacterium]|jgi:DNA-binding transcriptional MerR regulator